MRNGFDLSKFKKVKETDTHAVLAHPDGHHISIAKERLGARTRAQISKLPTTKMAAGGFSGDTVEESQDPPFRLEGPDEQIARGAREAAGKMAKRYSQKNMPVDATKMKDGGNVHIPDPMEKVDPPMDGPEISPVDVAVMAPAASPEIGAEVSAALSKTGAKASPESLEQSRYISQLVGKMRELPRDTSPEAISALREHILEELGRLGELNQENTHLSEKQLSPTPSRRGADKMAMGGMANLKEKYAKGGKVKGYDEGGGVAELMGDSGPQGLANMPMPAASPAPTQGALNVPGSQDSAARQPFQPLGNMPLPGMPTPQQAQAAAGQRPQMPMAKAYEDYQKALVGDYGQQMSGWKNWATAIGTMGDRNEQAQGDYEGKLMALYNGDPTQGTKGYFGHYQDLDNELTQALGDYNDAQIDPQALWHNSSTPAKVASAIGLVLGGIGSGLTHQPNQALELLNKMIDRDVMAQRFNLGKKATVIEGYLKQMGNLNDATKMTQAFFSDVYGAHLKRVASQMQGPLAQSQAQMMLGQLGQQRDQLVGGMAMQRAMLEQMGSGAGYDPMATVNMYRMTGMISPQMAEQAGKEVVQDQNHGLQTKNILGAFDQAVQENALAARAGEHAGFEPPSLAALHNMVLPFLKDNEGKISDIELQTIREMDPGMLDKPETTKSKREWFQRFLESKNSTPMLDYMGITKKRQQNASIGKTHANPNTMTGR